MSEYVFLLVDCNNFYCSCERIFNPSLKGVPIAVLSNNDGCIISRSDELKALNIPMAAPYHKYKYEMQKKGVKVFSSNYQLYGDISNRIMQILNQFAPEMEVYSIDEAFLKVKFVSNDELLEYAKKIKYIINKWTGIPVSIGIGSTKTLAKVANYFAKKYNKNTSGVYNICSKESQNYIFSKLNVGDLWGVGRQWAKKLQSNNIYTAKELRDVDAKWVRMHFSVVGERMVKELNGISCLDLEETKPKQSIMSSKSFGKAVNDKEIIMQALANYTARACEKLRMQNSQAQAVCVFIHTNRFSSAKQQYSNSVILSFDTPTNYTATILRAVRNSLNKIYKAEYQYHKAGIVLLGIVPKKHVQFNMLFPQETNQKTILINSIDQVNAKLGNGFVRFAAQGVNEEPWQLRSSLRSPRFTTNWLEIPQISLHSK